MTGHSAARPLCAGTDPFATPRPTPPSMTVMRWLSGPVLRVIAADGSVTLTPDNVDALVRIARAEGMISWT